MERVRVGFIGCGRHATKMLYPGLRMAGLELVAVCDLDEARAQRSARWFGAERAYTNHRAMLDDERLDAVMICTGPTTHARLISDAADRGLPVFVEKPPALTLAEAEAVRQHCALSAAPVMVGFMKRYALIYQKLKQIINAPIFGEASAIQARMAVGWKNGNGFALLLDMGIHMVDLLRGLMGDIAQISCQKYERDGTHINYALALRFESGAVGTLFISDQHHWMRANERIEVTGEGQYAIAENLVHLTHYLPDGQIHTWEPGFSIPNDENHSMVLGGYVDELRAFAESVRSGTPARPDLADACAALKLIKTIEPDEAYIKGPQVHTHWQAENRWLAD
jgi:myo-inositol 2-dehydrogenase/D-chiro-inositol 1-dehydrogenase